jgi:glycosyltransferase involved in cell wall biosynthesis
MWVALLGRRDEPTDALRDYCNCLQEALSLRGIRLDRADIRWYSEGSLIAFLRLWVLGASWAGRWVLIQYTALAWSHRGFSFRILPILLILRLRGARCAVIFHDFREYGGVRVIDRVRQVLQKWIMKRAYQFAHRSIFAVPVENVDWLPPRSTKAAFIAIGANLSKNDTVETEIFSVARASRIIAVYGVTGGVALAREVRDIAHAVRYASTRQQNLKLIVLGRNSIEAEGPIRTALDGASVQIESLGVVSSEKVEHVLSESDVLLFVRGPVSSSRSSALAGVACGLPIVGYRGTPTGFPMTEAGLLLVEEGDRDALGATLDHVLTDDLLRQRLRRRSLHAHASYFSWSKIAERFEAEMVNA